MQILRLPIPSFFCLILLNSLIIFGMEQEDNHPNARAIINRSNDPNNNNVIVTMRKVDSLRDKCLSFVAENLNLMNITDNTLDFGNCPNHIQIDLLKHIIHHHTLSFDRIDSWEDQNPAICNWLDEVIDKSHSEPETIKECERYFSRRGIIPYFGYRRFVTIPQMCAEIDGHHEYLKMARHPEQILMFYIYPLFNALVSELNAAYYLTRLSEQFPNKPSNKSIGTRLITQGLMPWLRIYLQQSAESAEKKYQGDFYSSILQYAIKRKNRQLLNFAVSADIIPLCRYSNLTPVRDIKIAEFLIANKEDVNKLDAFHRNILMQKIPIKLMKYYVSKGADVHYANGDGTVLHHFALNFPCSREYLDIAQFFIDQQVNINKLNEDNKTVLDLVNDNIESWDNGYPEKYGESNTGMRDLLKKHGALTGKEVVEKLGNTIIDLEQKKI